MKSSDLISTAEACEYLRISRSTLHRLVGRGIVPPPLRVTPRKHLYRAGDLDGFLNRLRAIAECARNHDDRIPF